VFLVQKYGVDMAKSKHKNVTQPVKDFGKYLKDKRVEAGLTQIEVSQYCGFGNSQFISNIERGCCWPPMDSLRKMAELYDIEPMDVLSLLVEAKKQIWANELGIKISTVRRR
jgi:transcriptional regulator with XRE-family HTH domain